VPAWRLLRSRGQYHGGGVGGSRTREQAAQSRLRIAGAMWWTGRSVTGCKLMRAMAAIIAAAGPVSVAIENANRARAQSSGLSQSGAFEVASIKPSAVWRTGGEGSSRSRIEHSPESLTMRNVDLSDCVQWAYGVKFFQIVATKTLDAERYDILAKTAIPVPIHDLRSMLQGLLAERFKLLLPPRHEATPCVRVGRGKTRTQTSGCEGYRRLDSACG
jgi:hypothetical protein